MEWAKPPGFKSLEDGERARVLHIKDTESQPFWRGGTIVVKKIPGEKTKVSVDFVDGNFRLENLALKQFQVLRPARNKKKMTQGAA